MDLLEDDWVGSQEEVEKTVDEGHVDTQEEYNGFCDEQTQWTTEILGDEFTEINLDLLLFGVNAPIECPAAERRSFLHKNNGRVGFFEKDEVETKGQEAHDGGEIFGPSPSKTRIHEDEASDERSEQGAREDGHGEDSDGQTTGFVVEYIREHSGDNGQGTGAKGASEKAGEHDCLEVFGGSGCHGENGEAKDTDDQRYSSAAQL